MPLLDGLFGKAGSGPVAIPVATSVPVAFRVYYTPGYPPLLPEDLRAKAAAWVGTYAGDPLRSALRPVIESPALSYTDMAKTAFPPPLDVLQKADVGAEERARLEAAWQVTVVACEARAQVPMFGLWAAVAAGRSAALELKGALFDAPAIRLTAIASYQQPIPGDGVLRVADHVAFLADTDPRGFVRWHTTGMAKFGLPEIDIEEAPPGLDLRPLGQALAQHLLDTLLRANHGREAPVAELVLGPEIALPLAGGGTTVRLFLLPGQGALPGMLAVLPPHDFKGAQVEFLAGLPRG